jgi:7-cyano-7-deazaguanine reductase
VQDAFPIKFADAKFVPIEGIPNPGYSVGHGSKAVQIIDPEFSSVCPKTGLPDYGRVILRYMPGELCVELKAWKLFLRSFYGVGMFHEAATQFIIENFVSVINPEWVELVIDWGARGGLHTTTAMRWTRDSGYRVHSHHFHYNEVMQKHAENWHNS